MGSRGVFELSRYERVVGGVQACHLIRMTCRFSKRPKRVTSSDERSATENVFLSNTLERGVEGSRRCVPYHAATRHFNVRGGAALSTRTASLVLPQRPAYSTCLVHWEQG